MAEPQRREHRNAQTHTHTQIPTDIHAGIGIGRELSNPPQSRAPPRGPAAQGATSYQASRRLQIRSALSPPAFSFLLSYFAFHSLQIPLISIDFSVPLTFVIISHVVSHSSRWFLRHNTEELGWELCMCCGEFMGCRLSLCI